ALYPALERVDVDRSCDQVHAIPALCPMPIVVLSADRPSGPQVQSMIAAGKLPADVPRGFGYVVNAAQKKAQEQLAKLVPNEKHITNTNSGHEIHKEQPQLVIDAIREVVEAVRSGRRQLTRSVTPRPALIRLQLKRFFSAESILAILLRRSAKQHTSVKRVVQG